MPHRHSKSAAEMATLISLSPFVIASRLTEMCLTAGNLTAKSNSEASEMVTEKIAAMGESALAMQMAMAAIALETAASAMTGIMRRNEDDADTVLAEGLKPFSKRAKANHARLSRLPQR
jgi:hypothetical protein